MNSKRECFSIWWLLTLISLSLLIGIVAAISCRTVAPFDPPPAVHRKPEPILHDAGSVNPASELKSGGGSNGAVGKVRSRPPVAVGHAASTTIVPGPAIPAGYIGCPGHPPGLHWWAPTCPPDARRGFVIISDPIIPYGDLDADGDLDVDDLNIGIDWLATANPKMDIEPCGGNGVTDADDLLALLRAFEGSEACE